MAASGSISAASSWATSTLGARIAQAAMLA
jgi:hypothetical protein